MNSRAKKEAIMILTGIAVIIFGIPAFITRMNRYGAPNGEISQTTQGTTRYIVKERQVYSKSFLSYFNPNDGKATYHVEVQKYKADNHGIKRWQYDKTINYGTHEPDLKK